MYTQLNVVFTNSDNFFPWITWVKMLSVHSSCQLNLSWITQSNSAWTIWTQSDVLYIYIIFSQFIIFLLLFSPEIDVRSKIFFFKNQFMRLEIFFIQKSYPTYFTITCNICWAVVFSIEQIFSTCCVVCCIKLEALHEGTDDGLIWSPHCFWNKIKNFSWTKTIFFH